jgi:hypothetical protein
MEPRRLVERQQVAKMTNLSQAAVEAREQRLRRQGRYATLRTSLRHSLLSVPFAVEPYPVSRNAIDPGQRSRGINFEGMGWSGPSRSDIPRAGSFGSKVDVAPKV